MLSALMGQDDQEDEFEIRVMSSLVGGPLGGRLLSTLRELAPQQLAELLRMVQNMALLNREHVGCFMPTVPMLH